MAKAKKLDPQEDKLAIPRERGCLECNRWPRFVERIWEDSQELCSEDTCIMLQK